MAAGAGSGRQGMLGLVVRAVHLPRSAPSGPATPHFAASSSPPGGRGEKGALLPGGAAPRRPCLHPAPGAEGRWEPPLPATPASGPGEAHGPIVQRRVCTPLLPCDSRTLEPRGRGGSPESVRGFGGRHLVGRGLKYFSFEFARMGTLRPAESRTASAAQRARGLGGALERTAGLALPWNKHTVRAWWLPHGLGCGLRRAPVSPAGD